MPSYCSVDKSCLILCDPHGLQCSRLPCPSPSPGACSNSYPSSCWCHPTISSSAPCLTPPCPFFLMLSIFPSIRVFSSELALCIRSPKYWNFIISPSNDLFMADFLLDWLVLSCSPRDSRVVSSTTNQFFSAQPSLWSNSHLSTWLLEKPYLWLYWPSSYFLSNTYQSVLSSLLAEG